MPRKIRELIVDLEKHGFVNRGGKGSHRNFTTPEMTPRNQEKAVKAAIEEAKR